MCVIKNPLLLLCVS